MIDLQIKWPDRETAVQCGKILGCTSDNEDGHSVTVALFGVINLALIGSPTIIDNTDPENPIATTIPGWWFAARVPSNFDIEAALSPIPEYLRPSVEWSSEEDSDRPVPHAWA